jgi:hypothetical protein
MIRVRYNGAMTISPQVIEITAGDVAAELKRRGISSDERVTLTIEPEQELIPGRREPRAHVVATGRTDADIDPGLGARLLQRFLKERRDDPDKGHAGALVEPHRPRRGGSSGSLGLALPREMLVTVAPARTKRQVVLEPA